MPMVSPAGSANCQDDDFQQQHSRESDHPSADAHTFPLHHQVHNEAPGGQESMFARPLTSDETQTAAATQQHQSYHEQSHDNSPQAFALQHQVSNDAPAELEPAEPLTFSRQASGSQDFVSQHQMNNASPASQQAMYSESLTSDRHPSHAQQPEHQASAGEGNDLLPSMRQPLTSAGQTSGEQDFALQHSMNNQAPPAETTMYARPLTSDQQHAGAQQQQQQQQHRQQEQQHQNEQQQHGDSEPTQVPEAHGGRQPVPVQQDDGQVPEARSRQAEEPHQSLTGNNWLNVLLDRGFSFHSKLAYGMVLATWTFSSSLLLQFIWPNHPFQ